MHRPKCPAGCGRGRRAAWLITSRSSSLQFAELQQAVHEQAQAAVGGQAAGGGVGGKQQAGVGQVRHDVADGCGGQRHGQAAGQGAAAYGLAGAHVLLDDLAQDGGGAGVQAGGEWLGLVVH